LHDALPISGLPQNLTLLERPQLLKLGQRRLILLPQLGEVQFLVGRTLIVAAIHLLGCLVVDPFLGHCLSFPLTPSCVTCGRASPHDGAAPKDTQEETRERAWGRAQKDTLPLRAGRRAEERR